MRGVARLKHCLWQALPETPRRWAAAALPLVVVPRARGLAADYTAPKPIVVGLFAAATGIGAGARMVADALQDQGYDPQRLDVSALLPGAAPGAPPPASHDHYGQNNPGREDSAPIIIHINSPQLPYVLARIRRILPKQRLIGFWAWELSRLPGFWRPGLRLVDELWVSSQFTARALRAVTAKPVRVMPYPVSPPPQSVAARQPRPPNSAYRFLHISNCGSSMARKNPHGVLRAFLAAHSGNARAQLHLHLLNPELDAAGMAGIQNLAAGHDNVTLTTTLLSQAQVWQLIADADAVVSLHRAEGFGLVPAQAMALAKPVIVTDWSGTRDFCHAGNALPVTYHLVSCAGSGGVYGIKGAEWAEPDTEQASAYMRKLCADPACGHRIGRIARYEVAHTLSTHAFAERYRAAATSACATPPNQSN